MLGAGRDMEETMEVDLIFWKARDMEETMEVDVIFWQAISYTWRMLVAKCNCMQDRLVALPIGLLVEKWFCE